MQDVLTDFIERYRRLVGPFAMAVDLDVRVQFNGEQTWIYRRTGTDNSHPNEAQLPLHIFPGAVLCVRPKPEAKLEEALLRMAENIQYQCDLESDQHALLDELSLSWESLEAVQEIGWKLRSVQNLEGLLEGIMTRTTAFQKGLCSILWQKGESGFKPIAAKGIEIPNNYQDPGELVVQAIKKGSGIIINNPEKLRQLSTAYPEVKAAYCVAVAPIATPRGSTGALEVWGNDPFSQFDSRTMRLLETLAFQAAMVIENDQLYRSALGNARLQKELEIGSRIQQTLLLGRPPVNIPGLRISAMSVASRYIDGDFYDFIDHDQSFLDVIVGDVMGKGVPAALLAAATKQQFLEAFARVKPGKEYPQLPQIAEMMTWVNRELSKRLSILDWFTTLCYFRFDLEKKRVEFIDAGHPKALHYKSRESLCVELKGTNLPLGLSETEQYYSHQVNFGSGDHFFLYSDGVTETQAADGRLFGEVRLSEFLSRNHTLPPEELIELLKKELIEFSGADLFFDDLTCVAVQIR